jgi:polar amino acid transport system substrate-binding protein
VTDSTWDRIQAAGKIVAGTSADYPPFEFYDSRGRLTGFDIALMNEIGLRLGLPVEYHDIAFESLGSAIFLEQIDTAIAALSVTEEREALVDFSNVYWVGEDGILARKGSGIADIDELDDLRDLRIGAQRSSVYDDWLHTNLVDTGEIAADQVFVYESAEHAVRDLRQDRLDLIMLDAQPAEAFALEGDLTVVGRGLNMQRLAIALPEGAESLKFEIDQVLTDLNNEGFIANLAREYLDVEAPDVLPTATPTPRPAATSTPPPPPACHDGLAFVQHLSHNDQNMSAPPVLNPGQRFTKAWRVMNTGTCTWDNGYQLVYANGNVPAAKMGGQPVAVQGQVAPGATYDIQVDLVAPLQPGTYQAFWHMENEAGQAFGERLPVAIRVPAPPTPTPAPTQTPLPDITFTADRTNIKTGECVTFYWKVQNVKAVYFFHDGERWQDNGVTGEESRQECPPFTLGYSLRVVQRNDAVDEQRIVINVEPATQAPVISRFTVDPPNQISAGQCVSIRWQVDGAVDWVRISSNGNTLWDGAPVQGNTQDCPGRPGNVAYAIEATGPGGTSRGQHNINVVGEATPTPPPPPPPDQPVIHSFAVTPDQIPAGSCVNVTWRAGGGTSWINIVRNDDIVFENAPLSGSVQDCPPGPGDYRYRMVAFNPQDERVRQDQFVTVR